MRVVVVVIRNLPFFCFQKVEWSHTLQHLYHGCASNIAGKITATIDIMRIQKMRIAVWLIAAIEKSVVFFGPFNETFLFIPYLVPDDIDGEIVFWLSIIAFFLSTGVVCQVYVGIACNIGIGEGEFFSIVIDITFSTTEYLTGKVSGIDVDIGAALYLCQTSTAIDIAVDFRCS